MLKWKRIRTIGGMVYHTELDGVHYGILEFGNKRRLLIMSEKCDKQYDFDKVKEAKARAEAVALNNKTYHMFS